MKRSVRLAVAIGLSLWSIASNCGRAAAQDPTVPSPQILERLKQPSEPVVSQRVVIPVIEKAEPLPIIKLKAMVLNDPDNGMALVEINGQRTRLNLSRSSASTETASNLSSGISIQGTTYFVESFSPRSILLNGRGQKLLIQ